jgi:hypothetical protein
MSAPSTDERASPLNRSPAPLLHLIEEVFARSYSYQMSKELAALLERESDLLAALQRLVFLGLTHHNHE